MQVGHRGDGNELGWGPVGSDGGDQESVRQAGFEPRGRVGLPFRGFDVCVSHGIQEQGFSGLWVSGREEERTLIQRVECLADALLVRPRHGHLRSPLWKENTAGQGKVLGPTTAAVACHPVSP